MKRINNKTYEKCWLTVSRHGNYGVIAGFFYVGHSDVPECQRCSTKKECVDHLYEIFKSESNRRFKGGKL